MIPTELEREVAALRQEMAVLKQRSQARPMSRSAAWLTAGVVGLALVTWSERAFSAACATGLVCFSAGTPAKADEINTNFDTLKKWVEAKVGALPLAPGAASSSPVSTGALTAATASVTGLTDLKGSLKFDCNACGDGAANWGDMTIQGRVMSADSNIHLSPPGGFNVVIQDNFRAAGGSAGGAGAGLTVQGVVTARSFAPQYDSGWFAVGVNANYTVTHNLGTPPLHIMLETCGATSGGNCTTRVVQSGPSGYHDSSGSCINPVNISSDSTNLYIATQDCAVWGYWVAGSGWTYTGDADGNSKTGFYRILAWR